MGPRDRTVATTGRMREADTIVMTGCSQPTTVTSDEASPTSSCASRRAPDAGFSPWSRRPPGKLTSPWCVRKAVERRVKTIRVSPSSS